VTAPTPVVSIYLPTSTAVTQATNATISRGRMGPAFPSITAGSGSVMLNNEDRKFDPLYTSSPYNGQIVPGKRANVTAGAISIFDGFISDWGFSYDVSGRSVATASLEDGLGKLGRAQFNEWNTTNGDQPGARFTAIMARGEVGYPGATSFDNGAFYLQSDYVSWGSNVLNYCQLVAQSDQGLFFVDRSGTLKFKDRLSQINAATGAAIGTGGIPFSQIVTSYGTTLLYNYVAVGRFGGINQTVTDATSVATYGATYGLSLTNLVLQDDSEALDLAKRLLSVYKNPLYRIESVVVLLHSLGGTDQTSMLSLDIGSTVTVTFTPNNVGAAITRTCVVEGIRHTIMPMHHEMELTLNDSSIAQTGHYWTVGDATYGGFSAGGVLNYPIAF
jgi:hypothetical protein